MVADKYKHAAHHNKH